MKALNLGIVAHVDAGKTSLTERLLHAAGVIDTVGSVDAGTTQTDTLVLERQRGITIRSAVTSFVVDDVTVNLIDTPGHPDFIAEVERVLKVLDGAVLVVSAVEGVQPQTRLLMRTLRRLGIPTLIFVNKIDRTGARPVALLPEITERLGVDVVAMGSVDAAGSREARFVPSPADDVAFRSALVDTLSRTDDAFLADLVDDEAAATTPVRLHGELVAQTRSGSVHPVFFGSAITGAGIEAVTTGLATLLPAPVRVADGPASGVIFKIERGAAGEKVAYLAMSAGTLRVRDRVLLRGIEAKITAVDVFERGAVVRRTALVAGEIGTVRGIAGAQIGDRIGNRIGDRIGDRAGDSADPVAGPLRDELQFAPPTLETVVVPDRTADRGALRTALTQLAEQDPLIDVRQDDVRQEITVSLYGEVQKEVIQATLCDEYDVGVTFRETTTICVERPIGSGSAVEIMGADDNPFLATIGLRIDPAPVGAGVRFGIEYEPGALPVSFRTAVEETVHETLKLGGLYGWSVTDCVVTMTHSGYAPRQSHSHAVFDKSMSSTAGDFRLLTPLVLMAALREARTVVHEPVHRFGLDVPEPAFGAVMSALSQAEAVVTAAALRGAWYAVEGVVAVDQVHAIERQLPTLTSGDGVIETRFDHYRAVRGAAPSRPRTDHNPLNRKEYLLHVVRRV